MAQPYFFQMKDESPFAFAGIWDEWRRNETSIVSCAIITTTANELLVPIHDRMPVILKPESYDPWLDTKTKSAALRNLLAPFPALGMKSHPVSNAVNHPQNDLVVRVDAEVGTTPSLF
jgi:putative SOS response-associated peptidase YedK